MSKKLPSDPKVGTLDSLVVSSSDVPPSETPDEGPLPCCSAPGCVNVADTNKRCGKCFVAMYCSRDCQVSHWSCHKVYCKLNRGFVLRDKTEEYLVLLNTDTEKNLIRLFGEFDESGIARCRSDLKTLGRVGSGACTRGRGVQSFTVAILEVLRGADVRKLRALASITHWKSLDDKALHLEALRCLQLLVEAVGTEEDVLDGLLAMGQVAIKKKKNDGLKLLGFRQVREHRLVENRTAQATRPDKLSKMLQSKSDENSQSLKLAL